jgi:hypothetical protein
VWKFKIKRLRKILKGWAINVEFGQNRQKKELIASYDTLDIMSENQPLSPCAKQQMKHISGEL